MRLGLKVIKKSLFY